MTTDRRTFLSSMTGLASLAPFLALEQAFAQMEKNLETAKAAADAAHEQLARVNGLQMHGQEQVAMLLYPNFTALDFVGPHFFFAGMMGATVHLVTNQKTLAPVVSDHGLGITPTVRMDDCPEALTVLFTPGGSQGTIDAMKDAATREFMSERAKQAQFITSVCTGSLLLAASGLLQGKRATSHWAVRDMLGEFDAIPVNQRVVADGNVITGAGVSAGLDFAITLVEKLRGRAYAQMLMLAAEYSPQPPIKGGTADSTDAAIVKPIGVMFIPMRLQIKEIALSLARA